MLKEIEAILAVIVVEQHKTKPSREKTKQFRMLYNPKSLNRAIGHEFHSRGWRPKKHYCDYSTEYYVPDYEPSSFKGPRPYREMDFVKDKLGVEVQFGKYAFMVYNVCAKMTIFRNLGHIECGIEIVPVRGFTREMSTGVAYFEQFTWDLKTRGAGNIDIPVLVLGIDADILIEAESEKKPAEEQPEVLQHSARTAEVKKKKI
ncbi:MAG TPA: BglII/BstYI family type II restriction endonuclease [Urbifossiella sp.]|nr:BglII/BstYI family type II restriction endonuclease [Urbifossiella sp.]